MICWTNRQTISGINSGILERDTITSHLRTNHWWLNSRTICQEFKTTGYRSKKIPVWHLKMIGCKCASHLVCPHTFSSTLTVHSSNLTRRTKKIKLVASQNKHIMNQSVGKPPSICNILATNSWILYHHLNYKKKTPTNPQYANTANHFLHRILDEWQFIKPGCKTQIWKFKAREQNLRYLNSMLQIFSWKQKIGSNIKESSKSSMVLIICQIHNAIHSTIVLKKLSSYKY